MQIHFQIEYFTSWGEDLVIFISHKDGSVKELQMANDGHGNWYLDFATDNSSSLNDASYKYAVKSQGNIIRYEEGAQHTIPAIESEYIVLADRWRDVDGKSIEQRTITIPYVRHNRKPLWKGAGSAIPVFSLRSEKSWGIGDFSDLKMYIDWAAATGQCIVQTLPINDTTLTKTWRDSYPYSANSSFALNPIYLDVTLLGLPANMDTFKEMEKERIELNNLAEIDYEKVLALKNRYIDIIYKEKANSCFRSSGYKSFIIENKDWLEPYAIYCYLRDKYGNCNFSEWDEKQYSPELLTRYLNPKSKAYKEVRKHLFVQYHLHKQLSAVKQYANSIGILLKGDLPIGVNRYSSDVWIHPELFHMDCQAGAPPDDFARDGQKWGMPTYNWDRMAEDRYSWFISRFQKMADYFDAYRIDHLLGFFRIWEVPLCYQSGLMGRFNPAKTFTEEEIRSYGFNFNRERDTTSGENETDILFLEDMRKKETYHPRILGFETSRFSRLSNSDQQAYRALHDDFYYNRNNNFWYHVAMSKLPSMIEATDMLVCGEDLGMIPECVPEVMNRLRILGLEVQRMPKAMGYIVGDPMRYPYMSVCTTSTHDMSVLRTWLEEEMPKNNIIGSNLPTTDNCKAILSQHLASASMLAIFPLQDWMSINEDIRHKNPSMERINVPANSDNYWRYRMHITLEELATSTKFNNEVIALIHLFGR